MIGDVWFCEWCGVHRRRSESIPRFDSSNPPRCPLCLSELSLSAMTSGELTCYRAFQVVVLILCVWLILIVAPAH